MTIHHETHGQGAPLLLGFPLMASPWPGDPELAVLKGYLERLTDRYRVLVVDYPIVGPGVGKSDPIPAGDVTADRVCADLLAAADAAGFDRFAFWGFSFGGVVGLQLACRTDRLTALVCGGWPPLGAPYGDMLRISRKMAAARGIPEREDPFVTFYESIEGWPEAEAVQRIACPRMTFTGAEDAVEFPGESTVRIGSTIGERRGELERLGWHVTEIPGRDHAVFMDPATVVPLVRAFLDRSV
ncbi:alpha/beta fold hydrolase [Sorangium sp. So ce1024]|uniref:alpha/beta fold hydrolase n=1 Tax=unclassified Sorangium TaxID=2621164 RepID=UPI003F084C7F